jgi:hypothetical protein
MRRNRLKRPRFRPSLELLEERRLLAQVLFGGDILKETFDDLTSNSFTYVGSGSSITQELDDPGTIVQVDPATGNTTSQQVGTVFHHQFTDPGAFLAPGGTTDPLAGQTSQHLFFDGDSITINPYYPPGSVPGSADVNQVAIDVTRNFSPTAVTFIGRNGSETLQAKSFGNQSAPSVITGTTTGPANNPPGTSVSLSVDVPRNAGWDTVVATEQDTIGQDSAGNPIELGSIQQIVINGFENEIDNARALIFFPGIQQTPTTTAQNDYYVLPQGAGAGQTFQSVQILAILGSAASVLANDTSASGFTPILVSDAAHGHVVFNPSGDGTFTYTPDSTFQGTDHFTYQLRDAKRDVSNTATVWLLTQNSSYDTDGDGVPDIVEAFAPAGRNGTVGDLNGDGAPDFLQSNVASLPAADGQYWSLVTSTDPTQGQGFTNVSNVGYVGLPRLPFGVNLPAGLFSFQVPNLRPRDSAVVRLIPQSGTDGANGFFVLDPHTHELVSFPGADVTATDTTLHLKDGQFGDFDSIGDGVISFVGGPATGVGTPIPPDRLTHPPVATRQYFPLEIGLGIPGDPPATLSASLLTAPPLIYGLPSGNQQGPPDQNDQPYGEFPNDKLKVRIVTPPTQGKLISFDPETGAFVYTPTTTAIFGADSFGYVVNDGFQDSAENFVIIGQTLSAPVLQSKYYKFPAFGEDGGSIGEVQVGVLDGLLNGVDLPNLQPLGPFVSHIVLDGGPNPPAAILSNGPKVTDGSNPVATIAFYPSSVVTDRTISFTELSQGDEFNSSGAFWWVVLSPPLLQPFQFDYHLTYQVASNPDDSPRNTAEIGVLVIPLQPGVSATSGIPDTIEAAGPNGGDGNGDGIPDNQQDNVASLPDATDGNYVTLASPSGTALVQVTAAPNPSPSDAPANVSFPVGFFHFSVAGPAPGGATTVTMFLPPGETVNDFWQYGPTPDVVNPDGSHPSHWYEWLYNSATGVGAQLLDSSGNLLRDGSGRQEIILHHVDGQLGDSDLTANGVIVDPGGPAFLVGTPAPGTFPRPSQPSPNNGGTLEQGSHPFSTMGQQVSFLRPAAGGSPTGVAAALPSEFPSNTTSLPLPQEFSSTPTVASLSGRAQFDIGGGDGDVSPIDEDAVEWLFLQGASWRDDAPLPRENAVPTSDPASSAPSGDGADQSARAIAET